MRRPAASLIFAVTCGGALVAARAGAEPPPIAIDYEGSADCPAEAVLLEEIQWRTSKARVASPGEDALRVRARIARAGALSRGKLVLSQRGAAPVTRELTGDRCDEVVSAFALVTALAIDPHARTSAKPPPPQAPPPPPQAPPPPAPRPPPATFELAAGEIVAAPLPAVATHGATPKRWVVGARGAAAFAATPKPLFAGAIVAERAFAGSAEASLRVGLEVGATGAFDTGPGRAWFLRAIARVEGCAFPLRPASRVALTACLALEGGALHGQGIATSALARAQGATVPWAGAGLLPRLAVDAGPLVLEAQGGPVLPLIRRTFVFETTPENVIHEVPALTGMVSLGVGVRFP